MYKAGVLTISDKGSQGQRVDVSGDYLVKAFRNMDMEVALYQVVADEEDIISRTLAAWADSGNVDLIVTTGGTGISPRDVTPEATLKVIEKELTGIVEIMRADGYKKTPTAILSRAVAGIRGGCLIVNLPGNPKAVQEYLDLLLPIVPHAVETMQGRAGDHT
ncbi:MAG: MogA/MoaB family molybdenum cofactor biosynthesis protein [Dehalococcoidia bacterium]|nr:MogA/MoaB family molybdenum cofactor biosynthesis protein [Dehalococcoidia bacterium]